MQYRKLKPDEVATFFEEQARYERWQAYAAYARNIYGARAARIVVAGDLVYNDETDVVQITQLEVFDAAGNEVAPDLMSDWWQTTLADQHHEVIGRPWDEHDWRDPRNIVLYQAQSALPVPPQRDDFGVTTPPQRRFPAVYAPIED